MASIKVTETMFNAVRTLLKGGATLKECSEYMGISTSSISLIKNSETYEEYKHKMYLMSGSYRKKMAAIEKEKQKEAEKVAKEVGAVPASDLVKKEPEQVVEHRQTVVVQASHYMLEEQKKTNELLELISKKLGRIIDDLYGIKGGEE